MSAPSQTANAPLRQNLSQNPKQDKQISNCSSWEDFRKLQDSQKNTVEQGDLFERLVQLYLLSSPAYAMLIEEVWWPKYQTMPNELVEHLNLEFPEEGIDLIAKTKEGEFWPIQAKYESDTSGAKTRGNLTSFSNAAFNHGENMQTGIVAHTKSKPIKKRRLLESEKKGNRIIELGFDHWAMINEFEWQAIRQLASYEFFLPKPRTPLPHQQSAIESAKTHFLVQNHSRGRLIMPCGTGKSLIGFWIDAELKSKVTVVLTPSLALIRDAVSDWTRELIAINEEAQWLCVCSDDSVVEEAHDQRDSFTPDLYELGLPVTTEPTEIEGFLRKSSPKKIIFCTYQSSPLLARAMSDCGLEIDLCIFDEAHKTTGKKHKKAARLLSSETVKIEKRLFMTATERVLRGGVDSDVVHSMDDENVYGARFHNLTYREAIECRLICDYKIVTTFVTEQEVDVFIRDNYNLSDQSHVGHSFTASSLASGVTLDKAMEQHNLRHAISFHNSIRRAENFCKQQKYLAECGLTAPDSTYLHVNGGQSSSVRKSTIAEFTSRKKAVLTNSRCLIEGVDIPAVDCVLFADPRESVVDVVQAAGRALRNDPLNKEKFAHIVIPIVVPEDEQLELFAERSAFKTAARQIAALATADERIVEYFRDGKTPKNPKERRWEAGGSLITGAEFDFQNFTESVRSSIWARLAKTNWRLFEEARDYARSLSLKGQKEWKEHAASGSLPEDIPVAPHTVYKNSGWVGYGDWVGTGRLANRNKVFRPFEDARKFVRGLGLKNIESWNEYRSSGQRPNDIPTNPNRSYKGHGWVSFNDWLGSDNISNIGRNWRSFDLAREYVRALNIQSQSQWDEFAKGDDRPSDIPSDPRQAYKNAGWIDMGDWLGTGTVAPQLMHYRPFAEARDFARKKNFKSGAEWRAFAKTPGKPTDIPASPARIYSEAGWRGMGDWLGTGRGTTFRPFEDARDYARSLNLKSSADWKSWCAAGKLPSDIYLAPHLGYKDKGWTNWGDFLGTGVIASFNRSYLSFEDARDFVRSKNLKKSDAWREFCKSGELPSNVPTAPNTVYKGSGWISFVDWLNFPPEGGWVREWWSFEKARTFVRNQKIPDQKAYIAWCKTSERPAGIPTTPWTVYAEWEGLKDWLGTTGKRIRRQKWCSFTEARRFARDLNLNSVNDWRELSRNKKLPSDIPAAPDKAYKDEGWVSFTDWLNLDKTLPFEEAREIVRAVGLKNSKEWRLFKAKGNLDFPSGIPRNPDEKYMDDGWAGIADWLGTNGS